MHKRILAIFVALVLLFCICAIPAAADSADEDLPYLELTDYFLSPADELPPGAFYVMGDYGWVGNFIGTLGEICAYGYEITYSWSGNRPNVTGVSFGNTTDNSFRNYYVDGTNLGKIRGSFNGTVGSDVGISFNSSGCYVTVHSVRVFLVENFQVELSAYLFGDSGSGATYTPGSSVIVSNMGYTTVSIDDWRNYDVINLSASLGAVGLTSVSARLMDNTSESSSDVFVNVPIDLSYANFSDYSGSQDSIFLNISCDMRGVDPGTAPNSTLYIYITSTVPSGQYGNLRVTSVSGSILIEQPDEYLPWLKNLFLLIQSSYGDIYSTVSSVVDKISEFDVRVQLAFQDVNNYLNMIRAAITNFRDDFFNFSRFYEGNLDDPDLTNPLWKNIIKPLRDMVTGTPVDPSVSQGMTSAGQELADLGQAMASGTPQVNTQVQVSVPDVPDDGSGILATTMFNFFWQQDYILKMLLTVVALATISYIFFGKKG